MNRRLVWLIALLPLLAGLGQMQPVQAQADAKAAQKEIQAFYDRWVDSFRRKDLPALMATLAADYVCVSVKGEAQSRKRMESVWREGLKTIKSIESLSISAGKVTLKGDEATNVATFRFAGVVVDPKGKERPGTNLIVTRDTLVRTPKGWMFKRSQDIEDVATIDGKRVNSGTPVGTKKKPHKK